MHANQKKIISITIFKSSTFPEKHILNNHETIDRKKHITNFRSQNVIDIHNMVDYPNLLSNLITNLSCTAHKGVKV